MTVTLRKKDNGSLKGFTLECGVVEMLVISVALQSLLDSEDRAESDKVIAREMIKTIKCLDTNCSENPND